MTQEQWDDMSGQQRHEYLAAGEIKIIKRAGIRSDAKVGDDNACVTRFAAECRGVRISNWHETNTAALKHAADFIDQLAMQ